MVIYSKKICGEKCLLYRNEYSVWRFCTEGGQWIDYCMPRGWGLNPRGLNNWNRHEVNNFKEKRKA